MYRWSRQIRMLGGAAAAAWAMEVTEKANAAYELELRRTRRLVAGDRVP